MADTTAPASSSFKREQTTIRDWVTANGSSGFTAEPGRYYMTHPQLNPSRMVAVGPDLDYDAPHGREAL